MSSQTDTARGGPEGPVGSQGIPEGRHCPSPGEQPALTPRTKLCPWVSIPISPPQRTPLIPRACSSHIPSPAPQPLSYLT